MILQSLLPARGVCRMETGETALLALRAADSRRMRPHQQLVQWWVWPGDVQHGSTRIVGSSRAVTFHPTSGKPATGGCARGKLGGMLELVELHGPSPSAGNGFVALARGPNNEVPMRTKVDPSSMATSKSPLIPMLN